MSNILSNPPNIPNIRVHTLFIKKNGVDFVVGRFVSITEINLNLIDFWETLSFQRIAGNYLHVRPRAYIHPENDGRSL